MPRRGYGGYQNEGLSNIGEGIGSALAAWFILRPEAEKKKMFEAMMKAAEKATLTGDRGELQNLYASYGPKAREEFIKRTGNKELAPNPPIPSFSPFPIGKGQLTESGVLPPGLMAMPQQAPVPWPTTGPEMAVRAQHEEMRGGQLPPAFAQEAAARPYAAVGGLPAELRPQGYAAQQDIGAIPPGSYPQAPRTPEENALMFQRGAKVYPNMTPPELKEFGEKGHLTTRPPNITKTEGGAKMPFSVFVSTYHPNAMETKGFLDSDGDVVPTNRAPIPPKDPEHFYTSLALAAHRYALITGEDPTEIYTGLLKNTWKGEKLKVAEDRARRIKELTTQLSALVRIGVDLDSAEKVAQQLLQVMGTKWDIPKSKGGLKEWLQGLVGLGQAETARIQFLTTGPADAPVSDDEAAFMEQEVFKNQQ